VRRHPGEDWIRQVHVDLLGLWEAAALQVVEAYDVAVGPRWRIELDPQPYTEVWLISSGACALELGAQRAVAQPGDVVVLLPGTRRASFNPGPAALALAGFGCSLTLLDGVDLLSMLDCPLVVREPSEELRLAVAAVSRMSRGSDAERIFGARAEAARALMAIAALTRRSFSRPRTSLRVEVAAALEFIADHDREPLDVHTIAAAVHLSPQHLTRCFRESLGIAPMAYVRRHRLNRARELLIATPQPVTEVMAAVGFTHLAHFSRAFKLQFGITPKMLQQLSRRH
jgi:AraC-like DNA-binding protein